MAIAKDDCKENGQSARKRQLQVQLAGRSQPLNGLPRLAVAQPAMEQQHKDDRH